MIEVDADNMHRHKCDKCNTVWRHSFKARGRLAYHRCPECGREQWIPYDGPEEATITQEVVRRDRGGGSPGEECS